MTEPSSSSASSQISLLVLTGVWPSWRHPREAANAVAYRLVSELASRHRFKVIFGIVSMQAQKIPDDMVGDIDELKRLGVSFLQPITITRPTSRILRLLRGVATVVSGQWKRLLHGYGEEGQLRSALKECAPDAVLTIWSEVATAMAAGLKIPAYAYYGNLDHKVLDAQFELTKICVPAGLISQCVRELKKRILVLMIRSAHVSLMKRYRRVWNVSASDADEQSAAGVRADYMANVWITGDVNDWQIRRNHLEQTSPIKIVGNVGNLSATGNSFGLITLARDVIPALKDLLGPSGFEIHLFGGSSPRPCVAEHLNDPVIHIRGFVEDLDSELLSAPVFLIANNHHKFKVGHTRILHAWSLGGCVVAFDDIRQAMPEVLHGKNALLGRNASEVANLIKMAAQDVQLRRNIGAGGLETLKDVFNPELVAKSIAAEIVDEVNREPDSLAHVGDRSILR